MRIALYEPDIPQNTGTILRTCACLGVEAHIIEPAGFPVTDRAFRRAGMDYLDHAFAGDQIVLFGRESAGVPQAVHDTAEVRLRIPVAEGLRSLNIAVSAAMVMGEALRQMRQVPG